MGGLEIGGVDEHEVGVVVVGVGKVVEAVLFEGEGQGLGFRLLHAAAAAAACAAGLALGVRHQSIKIASYEIWRRELINTKTKSAGNPY